MSQTEQPFFKLYSNNISYYSQIVRVALEEKNLDYEIEEIDIFKQENISASYAKKNPKMTVPTLQIGKDDENPKYITDSSDILEEL